jgi:hypothetical protein
VDEVVDTPDVAVACDPLAESGNVAVVALLLVTEVEEAACNACNSGSVLDPLVLPESLLLPDPSELPIWAW